MVENDSEAYYSDEEEVGPRGGRRKGEPEEGHRPLGHTIERVAETIADLPAAVPRESAVLIEERSKPPASSSQNSMRPLGHRSRSSVPR